MALVGLYFAFLFIGGHIIMSTRLLALSLRTQFGVVEPNSGRLLRTADEFEEAADACSIGGREAPELVKRCVGRRRGSAPFAPQLDATATRAATSAVCPRLPDCLYERSEVLALAEQLVELDKVLHPLVGGSDRNPSYSNLCSRQWLDSHAGRGCRRKHGCHNLRIARSRRCT